MNNIEEYDSLRTVVKMDKSPFKMYHIENDVLTPYFTEYNGIKEPYNNVRQLFPQNYLHNGCVDIIKTSVIVNGNSMSGTKIYPYIMDDNEVNDIDTIEDFSNSLNALKR